MSSSPLIICSWILYHRIRLIENIMFISDVLTVSAFYLLSTCYCLMSKVLLPFKITAQNIQHFKHSSYSFMIDNLFFDCCTWVDFLSLLSISNHSATIVIIKNFIYLFFWKAIFIQQQKKSYSLIQTKAKKTKTIITSSQKRWC